jgi:hypothetical protein
VVYLKEIHPSDGWQVKENEPDGVVYRQHQSMEERVEVGQSCMLKLALEMPALVDDNAMPERLYLIGKDGRIAYKGGVGPMFFFPDEWERAIGDHLNGE